MSDTSQGDGWWVASDGKWYAPELHPDYVAPVGAAPSMGGPPTSPPAATPPSFGTTAPGAGLDVADSGGSGSNRMPLIFGALGVAVLLAALGFFVLGGDDGDDDPGGSAAATGDDVADPDVDPDLGSDPDVGSDPGSDPDLGSDSGTDPDLGSDPGTDPDLGSDPGTDPDLGSDSGTDPTVPPESSDDPSKDGDQLPTVVPGSAECTFIEIDFADDIQVELRFTSPTTVISDIDVAVTLFDANGAVFGERSEPVPAALPGEPFRIEHDTFTEFPVGTNPSNFSCEVTEIAQSNFPLDFTLPTAADLCRIVELDSFSDIQIELVVTNPFGETVDVGVQYVLRRGGERFDGDNAFLGAMGAGETITEDYDTLADLPVGAELSDLECQVVGLRNWS